MANAVRRGHQSKTLKFELQAEQQVAQDINDKLMDVYRDMTALYVQLSGDFDAPLPLFAQKTFKSKLLKSLRSVDVNPAKLLLKLVKQALGLGVDIGKTQTGGQKVVVMPRPDKDTRRAINKLNSLVKQDLKEARDFVRQSTFETFDDLGAAMSKANKASNRVEATTRWVTNRAINTGSTVVAKAVGADVLWVPERGACLTCLAYSGLIAKAGSLFPAGKTFGDPGKGSVKDDTPGPPAHPNCRCRLVPWLGSTANVGSVEFPDALKREAQRAVLRGTAYDSKAARLRAADRLLVRGTRLPKTVVTRAQRAVQAGRFAR